MLLDMRALAIGLMLRPKVMVRHMHIMDIGKNKGCSFYSLYFLVGG